MNQNFILFCATKAFSLKNSRKEIIKKFLDNDWSVVIATSFDDVVLDFNTDKIYLEPVRFAQGHFDFLSDLRVLARIKNIIKFYKPKIIHNFNGKPIILTSYITKFLPKKFVLINTVTGLGFPFKDNGLVRFIALRALKMSCKLGDITIFQNNDDLSLFIENKIIKSKNARLIVSSGVDTKKFKNLEKNYSKINDPVIVMIGRLIWSKGVKEFIEVGRKIKEIYPKARMIWAGNFDKGHPDSVNFSFLENQNHIEFIGFVDDIVSFLKNIDILLFTSTYREGVPRAILESASMGIPTIAFNIPGVRESVIHNETGFLIPQSNIDLFTQKAIELVKNAEKRKDLGSNAREMVLNKFDISQIHMAYFKIYEELGFKLN